ncbi:MAG: YceI family protein [Hyphomicrobium sp.]|jgi:polyisoprenoid-binding protein YceI
MKLTPVSFALIAALLSAAPATAADYVIDTDKAHASVNFRIKHLGFSWLTGRFDNFKGTFSFDESKPDASKVKVEVNTDSINSNHAERDKHLRGKDFLDTASFPTATFESTSVKLDGDKATITGNLTLHGVTKQITIDAKRVGGGSDPWGGYREGFTGTTTLALKDFGINYNLGPASETVELALEIEGVRQ